MTTSKITRRMLLPALFLGLTGFAQAAPNQTQGHHGGHVRPMRVVSSATLAGRWTLVRTSIRGVREYVRLPMLKLHPRRSSASARHREGRYTYTINARMVRSRVSVSVTKYRGHRRVGHGSTVARVRGQRPDRKPTYVVSRYHPLTGRHIHTQRFNDREAALKWYRHNRQLWWVFVYGSFSKKPKKEYRGTQSVCMQTAKRINANLFDGKRAKAMPPRITFKTMYR